MTDFVFLYGPPAVGKYTIGKMLSAYCGYRLFHNHLAIDYVESVIPWGTPGFWPTIESVRKQLIGGALENGHSMIATFAYGRPHDDPFIGALLDTVRKSSARFCAVQLTCARDTLFERVADAHRARMGKAALPEVLEDILTEHDCFSEIGGIDSLLVNTDHLSPSGSVTRIAEHFRLPKAS